MMYEQLRDERTERFLCHSSVPVTVYTRDNPRLISHITGPDR